MAKRLFKRRTCTALTISIAAATLCGCSSGDRKVVVSGSVTLDGKPIPEGFVTFAPEGSGSPDAGPIHNGKFTLKAIPGKHRIKVEASRPVGPVIPSMGGQIHEEYIPPRYNSETILSEEVKSGEDNVFDFSLTSKKE